MGGSGGRTGQGSRSDTDSNPSPALHSPVTAAKRLVSLKCRPVLVRAGRRAQWLSTRVLPCDARSSPAPPAPHHRAVPRPLLPRAAPGTPATAHLAALDRAQGAEAQALASIPQGGCGAVCCRLSWCQVQDAGPPCSSSPENRAKLQTPTSGGSKEKGLQAQPRPQGPGTAHPLARLAWTRLHRAETQARRDTSGMSFLKGPGKEENRGNVRAQMEERSPQLLPGRRGAGRGVRAPSPWG